MDFNTTVDLIIRELNEAVEIIEDFKSYQNVPFLQVELAKSKCRNAADVIRLLKNIQDNSPAVKELSEQKITSGKQVIEKPVTVFKKQEKTEQKPDNRSQEVVKTKKEPSVTVKEAIEKVTLGDTLGQSTGRLNERIGVHKEDDDLRELIRSKPINRLSEAIGINDKFLFIRELFNGNSELYNQTISSLDNSGNIDDASTIVMNITGDDTKKKSAQLLLELVKRKFQVNE
jgi:hypothetical protein